VVPRVVDGGRLVLARRGVLLLRVLAAAAAAAAAAVLGRRRRRRQRQVRGSRLNARLLGRKVAAVVTVRYHGRPIKQRDRRAVAVFVAVVVVVVLDVVVEDGVQVVRGGEVFLQRSHGRELAHAQPTRVRRQGQGGRVGEIEPRERGGCGGRGRGYGREDVFRWRAVDDRG